jgi:hypothetical protein
LGSSSAASSFPNPRERALLRQLRNQNAFSSHSVHAAASAVFLDVPADAWYLPSAEEAIQQGWMKSKDGMFYPAGTVTTNDVAMALRLLGINISSLDALPRDPSSILSKGQFLQIFMGAFHEKLAALTKNTSQSEYNRVWNALPPPLLYGQAIRMAVIAHWIAMPSSLSSTFAPITRAEMAKILSSVVAGR